GDTLGVFFDRAAARFGEGEALVVRHQDVRWTWRELQTRVDQLAASLMRLGLRPGERVGIWSQNNAEWLLTQLATAKAGLILVNINPASPPSMLHYPLNRVGCRALTVSRKCRASDSLGMLHELAPELPASEPGWLAA